MAAGGSAACRGPFHVVKQATVVTQVSLEDEVEVWHVETLGVVADMEPAAQAAGVRRWARHRRRRRRPCSPSWHSAGGLGPALGPTAGTGRRSVRAEGSEGPRQQGLLSAGAQNPSAEAAASGAQKEPQPVHSWLLGQSRKLPGASSGVLLSGMTRRAAREGQGPGARGVRAAHTSLGQGASVPWK